MAFSMMGLAGAGSAAAEKARLSSAGLARAAPVARLLEARRLPSVRRERAACREAMAARVGKADHWEREGGWGGVTDRTSDQKPARE
ncbi:hypothetical protein IP76_08600 [Rhizobium sp. AAP43]|nr:hypothetical protein IP76_08600 [Rhizobium sp. AAP43]